MSGKLLQADSILYVSTSTKNGRFVIPTWPGVGGNSLGRFPRKAEILWLGGGKNLFDETVVLQLFFPTLLGGFVSITFPFHPCD